MLSLSLSFAVDILDARLRCRFVGNEELGFDVTV